MKDGIKIYRDSYTLEQSGPFREMIIPPVPQSRDLRQDLENIWGSNISFDAKLDLTIGIIRAKEAIAADETMRMFLR